MTSARDIIDTLPVGAKFKVEPSQLNDQEFEIKLVGGVRYAVSAAYSYDISSQRPHNFSGWAPGQIVVTHNPDLVRDIHGPFKVGDRVRLTGEGWTWEGTQPGKRGDIVTVIGEGGGGSEGILDGGYAIVNHGSGLWAAELVTDEQTYDSYHPSMLPMLAKVAQLAEDRGLCPEFDRILKDIGAPDRAEIKRLTQPKANAPTETGVWALRRKELSETGDMEEFSDLFLHTERGWYRIGNDTAIRSELSPEEIELIFTNNEPVRLTYSEES